MKTKLSEHRAAIATMAMMGLLADHKDERRKGETCPECVARLAVEHADALLKELSI